MEYSEQVLILQVGKFREADLWVRFLSPSKGLLSAFAFGGSRSKRRFTGCLDVCNEVLLRVKSSRQGTYLALQEGVLINGPARLRRDWLRFGAANNCIKFLQSFGIGADGADKAHFLLTQILRLLEEEDTLPEQLPLFFRSRLVFDQGYALRADCCAACGEQTASVGAYLDVQAGQMLCSVCGGNNARRAEMFFLRPEALALLGAVQTRPPEEWRASAAVIASPAAYREWARAMDHFIRYHVGLSWENGYFVRV